MTNENTLLAAAAVTMGANAIWWVYISPWVTGRWSNVEWFLSNKELHNRSIAPFDPDVQRSLHDGCYDDLITVVFLGEHGDALPQAPGDEPSIVVDFAALDDETLDRISLPKLTQVDPEVFIEYAIHANDDGSYDQDDEDPSIVIDYAQLYDDRSDVAIALNDEEDDAVAAFEIDVEEVEEVVERKYLPAEKMEQIEMFA